MPTEIINFFEKENSENMEMGIFFLILSRLSGSFASYSFIPSVTQFWRY